MELIHKSFPVEIIKADTAQGIIDAIVAVIGNVDLGNDVIHPGAFTKTLSERGNKVRVLDNHNSFSIKDVIGKPISIREILMKVNYHKVLRLNILMLKGVYTLLLSLI
jgi:hypothetical protein